MAKFKFKKNKKLIMIAVMGCIIMGVSGFIFHEKFASKGAIASEGVKQVNEVELYNLPDKEKVYLPGKIIPKESKSFYLEGSDGIVEKVNVKNGATVKKGDLLYSCKNSEKLKEATALKKELTSKRSELKSAEEDLVKGIKDEIKNLEQEINELTNAAYKRVYAPFSGKIYISDEEKNNEGEGSSEIMTLETSTYYIKSTVNELDLIKLSVGQDVKITVLSSKAVCDGTISSIGERPVDPSEDTGNYGMGSNMSQYTVKIDVEDQRELKNGFNVHSMATVGSLEKKVPNTAIIKQDGKNYVYRIENDIAKKVEVKIKDSNDEYTVILEGLNDGDIIARDGSYKKLENGKSIHGEG